MCVCVQPVKKNDSPEWEERFQFILQEPPTGDTLHVEVKSKDSDMLGKITHHKVSPALPLRPPGAWRSISRTAVQVKQGFQAPPRTMKRNSRRTTSVGAAG